MAVRAAIVGIGIWGRKLVAAVQGKSTTIRFAAGVTGTPAKAAEFARGHGFPLTGDYHQVLADPEIDAVVLATPNSQHAEQMMAAAAAGKHIFVEKPVTLTKASAEAAIAAAADAGVVVAAGHNRRFLPAIAELGRLMSTGGLGELMHVETNYSGPSVLTYPPELWRSSRIESPAGAMTASGIHMIDTMIGLWGRVAEVHAVSFRRVAHVDIDDTTAVLLRFENGMSGYLGNLGATARLWRVQAFGSRGWAEIRDETRLEIAPVEGEGKVVAFPPVDKERAELEAFAAAIRGQAAYPVTVAEAIHGIAVMEAVDRSAKTGRTVTVT